MRIVNLSYVYVPEFNDPKAWLKRISFSTGVLESLSHYAESIGIYNINYKGILKQNEVTYHFPKYKKWGLLFPFQFNRYVKKLNPDVVIVHGLISPWQVIMLRWQVGKNLTIIAQHHSEPPLRDIRQYIQRWADQYIKAYLFGSFDLGYQWVQRSQIRNQKKIKEIMGNSSPFHPMDKEIAKSKTGVIGDKIFLWVGGLDANKDPLLVVRSFIRFVRMNPFVKLYMIYQTFQLLDELKEQLINAPDVAESIILVGKIRNEELLHWYNSSEFIISSSHYEGGGIAVCEAMSCGCIPILTNIPSFRMMTNNGRIGLLYDAGNEDALLGALQKILDIDSQEEKKKVLEQFHQELSFDANARKIMNVIHELE